MQNLYTDWYAAFVKTGEEDDVKTRMEYKFGDRFNFLFPKRKLRERKDGRWNDVLRPLFPGYILINGIIKAEEYYNFKNVPGLWKLLSSRNELLEIQPSEIEFISRLTSNGEIIGPSCLYQENGHVQVVDGPLSGMEGRIIKVDKRKGRAKVSITFLSEEHVIDLAITMLA